jgi:hypothetical protein
MSARPLIPSLILGSLAGFFSSTAALGQQSDPLADPRPPLFIGETFPVKAPPGFDFSQQIIESFSQAHIESDNVELAIYGQTLSNWVGLSHEESRARGTHQGLENVWGPVAAYDPSYIFFGPCFTPCAFTLKDTNNLVDLSGIYAKVKWRTRQSGFHNLQVIIKLENGDWYIGDYQEPPAIDWQEREFSFADLRWQEFNPEYVVTEGTGNFTETPDLSRVDEVGVTSLMPGNLHNDGHGPSSTARIDFIEIYGKPVPR